MGWTGEEEVGEGVIFSGAAGTEGGFCLANAKSEGRE